MMWKRNDKGEWNSEYNQYREALWSSASRYSLIGGVVITVSLIIVSLAKGNGWQKTFVIAISGVLVTAVLWLLCSLPLIAAWASVKLAKLVKKIFRIKKDD